MFSEALYEKRKAIIVGANGQDGRHLSAFLSDLGYDVFGVTRQNIDILIRSEVDDLVSSFQPNEIYFLAAYHHSSEMRFETDAEVFEKSNAVHTVGVVHFLDAVSRLSPETRVFYASSSHIYPGNGLVPIDEGMQARPQSFYALTKYNGMLACQYFREQKNVYVSCGVLFNHESSLRPDHFLSRKIAIAAAAVSHRKANSLELGSMEAVVDWGYAPDYVDAMWRILQIDNALDFIVATGEPHTVREFAEIAFRYVGLEYKNHIRLNPNLLSKSVEARIGNPKRLFAETGWVSTRTFSEMVENMVQNELDLLSS